MTEGTGGAAAGATLRIGLGEYDTGWHDPPMSLARAASVVADAARAGAQLVALPEMATTGFTMESAAHAEPLDGPSARGLARFAREEGVHLVAGLALREEGEAGPTYTNGAVLFDPRGDVQALYRKQRLFAYAGEHGHYRAGDASVVTTVHGVRLGLFVCYDLRFPELFRAVARDVDAIVLIANWPASRRAHWDVLLRARAIENQCYVIGVNRTGSAGGLEYDGGSAAHDPFGEPLACGPSVVTVEAARVAEVRRKYPFLGDLTL